MKSSGDGSLAWPDGICVPPTMCVEKGGNRGSGSEVSDGKGGIEPPPVPVSTFVALLAGTSIPANGGSALCGREKGGVGDLLR